MNHPSFCFPLSIAGAVLLSGAIQAAGNGHTPAPQPQGVATNTPAAANAPALTIPISVFVLPGKPEEGKDPFFPRSLRPYATVVIKTTNTEPVVVPPTPVAVEVHLDGISGTPERRLAIINYHTFEAGEEADLPARSFRVHIRCLEVKADSVVIQVAGERRVLRLRSGL
jgi:hypothetical protein